MSVIGISQFLGGDTVILIKNGRYSIFQSPNGDGKIQFLIENTTVTVFLQIFDYSITAISMTIDLSQIYFKQAKISEVLI